MKRILIVLVLAIAVLSSNLCVQNWQCRSLFCQEGRCAQDFMCTPLDLGRVLYAQCDTNEQCNSTCCMLGWCVPNYSCDAKQSQAIEIKKQQVQKIVQEAKDELKFRSVELWGTCDYNFQCRSDCCKSKTCTFFSSACNDQNAMGDRCIWNQDCHSSCCHAGRCSPIWECTNDKKQGDYAKCKFNAQCKSGCCAFGTCRKDMFWCQSEKTINEECYFNSDCLSSCCEDRRCSHVYKCYTAEDYLREDDPRLSVFYSFLYHQDEEILSEEEEQELIEASKIIDSPVSSNIALYIFLGSLTVLIALIVLAVKFNLHEKWMRGHENHYTSLIEGSS